MYPEPEHAGDEGLLWGFGDHAAVRHEKQVREGGAEVGPVHPWNRKFPARNNTFAAERVRVSVKGRVRSGAREGSRARLRDGLGSGCYGHRVKGRVGVKVESMAKGRVGSGSQGQDQSQQSVSR